MRHALATPRLKVEEKEEEESKCGRRAKLIRVQRFQRIAIDVIVCADGIDGG